MEKFFLNINKKQLTSSRGSSAGKDKDKKRNIPSIRKQQQDASHREAAAAKRMQELMRQFGTILRQVCMDPFHVSFQYYFVCFAA